MARCRRLAVFLGGAVITAWWNSFSSMWSQIDEAVDEKNGLLESSLDGDFAPHGDPANADWD